MNRLYRVFRDPDSKLDVPFDPGLEQAWGERLFLLLCVRARIYAHIQVYILVCACAYGSQWLMLGV